MQFAPRISQSRAQPDCEAPTNIYPMYCQLCTYQEEKYSSHVVLPVFKRSTSWPPQEKLFICSPFFEYNKRLLDQKVGGACLYMPQNGH